MDDLFNRVRRQRRGGQKGFTLIELLVVIAVLAVLAAIVIFNVLGVTNHGESASACTDSKSVQTAVDSYLNDGGTALGTGAFTAAEWNALSPKYIHTQPPAKYGNITVTFGLVFANGADASNGYNVTVTGVTCP